MLYVKMSDAEMATETAAARLAREQLESRLEHLAKWERELGFIRAVQAWNTACPEGDVIDDFTEVDTEWCASVWTRPGITPEERSALMDIWVYVA